MGKAACINGHYLWDGDGKSCVEAYRLNFFRELMRREPDCVIHGDYPSKYLAI